MSVQEKQGILLLLQNSLLQTRISCGDERSDEIFRSENAFFASDIRDVARNGNDKIQKAVKKTGKEAVGQKRGSGKGSVCADKRSKEGHGVSK
jgi:hypothetical protein